MTCAMIESARSSFVYHEDGLKRLLPLKKYSWPGLCFTDGSAAGGGNPDPDQWSSVFIHSIAEYWALHSVYWEVTVWLATVFFLLFIYWCVGYMTIGITSYQKTPDESCFFLNANRCLKIIFFFFFGFVLFFVVFFFCSFCIVDNKIISPDVLDFYYMTTFCKHWSNHNI